MKLSDPIFNSLGSNYSSEFRSICWSLYTGKVRPEGARDKLIKYCNQRFQGRTVLMGKGRQAISFALSALGLGKGDSILIQANTCFAVYQGVKHSQVTPQFVDVDKKRLNLSLKTLESAMVKYKQSNALLVQHTLGYPVANMEKICEWCKKHKLFLIEDLAHAVGAKAENGEDLGSFGDAVILSFGQDKIWDALTGGAVVIKTKGQKGKSTEEQKSVKTLRGRALTPPEWTREDHKMGMLQRYSSPGVDDNRRQLRKLLLYPEITHWVRRGHQWGIIGKVFDRLTRIFNLLPRPVDDGNADYCNMAEEIAYLALYQVENLETNLKHRRKIAIIYDSELDESAKIVNKSEIKLSSNLRYPLLVDDAEIVKFQSKQHGLHIFDTWYDSPVAPIKYLPLVQEYVLTSYPNAEFVTDHLINLPTHKQVTPEIAKQISDFINKLIK